MNLYNVVACQTACPTPRTPEELDKNIEHACDLIRWGIEVYCQSAPVKLVAFPELALVGHPRVSHKELYKMGVEIPGRVTDRFVQLAKEFDLYIMPGSFWESDPDYKVVFNTAFLVGPQGMLLKYRKFNPWWPASSLSPHDLLTTGYDLNKTPLFPVANTEIGNIGVAICYDMLFPEVARQLAYNGAEILIGATAWFDPYGAKILDWWNTVTKARSIENICYGLYVGSGSSVSDFPPMSTSGYSQMVDFEGRVLAITGEGEKLTSALFNIDMLRYYRKTCRQNNFLAANRIEGYDYWKTPKYKMTPEVAKKEELNMAEADEIMIESFEEFYSKYYDEEVHFPRYGQAWWDKFKKAK